MALALLFILKGDQVKATQEFRDKCGHKGTKCQISITEQAVEILQTRSYIQIHVSLAAHVIRKLLNAVKEQDGKQKKKKKKAKLSTWTTCVTCWVLAVI